jgi:hypothetical protein
MCCWNDDGGGQPRTELKLCPYEGGQLGWEKRIKEWLERLRRRTTGRDADV